MDRIDRAILAQLQDNARISNVELANAVGLSPSACLRRVTILEKSGVIDGYHAQLNAAEFEAAAADIPQVLACFLIAGESDYILRVAARDVGDFGRLHAERLSALPHVLRMESSFVMRDVFTRSLAPSEA